MTKTKTSKSDKKFNVNQTLATLGARHLVRLQKLHKRYKSYHSLKQISEILSGHTDFKLSLIKNKLDRPIYWFGFETNE